MADKVKSFNLVPGAARKFGMELSFLSSTEENPSIKLIPEVSKLSGIDIKPTFEKNHWAIQFIGNDPKTNKNLFSLSSPFLQESKGFQEILKICDSLRKLECVSPSGSHLLVHLDP